MLSILRLLQHYTYKHVSPLDIYIYIRVVMIFIVHTILKQKVTLLLRVPTHYLIRRRPPNFKELMYK